MTEEKHSTPLYQGKKAFFFSVGFHKDTLKYNEQHSQ